MVSVVVDARVRLLDLIVFAGRRLTAAATRVFFWPLMFLVVDVNTELIRFAICDELCPRSAASERVVSADEGATWSAGG